jgi:phenylacetate-CoA ligase
MNNKLALLIYKIAAKYRSENTFKYLDFYRKTQWWSKQEMQNYRDKCIRQLITSAKHNIPFYKQIEKFEDCPIISKKNIKENPQQFVSVNRPKKTTVKNTAGSTGEPLYVIKDANSMAHEQAITFRGYEWAGVHPGDLQIRFWGVPVKKSSKIYTVVRDFALNRIRFSAFQLSDDYFFEYYKAISKLRKRCYLYGYSSMIADFSEYLLKTGKTLTNIISVITTSDLLTAQMRQQIQTATNAKVFIEYGCSEIGTIAHEAENGKLYINSENLFLEVLDSKGEIKSSGIGELIVTEFHNYLQPIIRYNLGDTVELLDSSIDDKRHLQIIENLSGRTHDSVVGPKNVSCNPMFFSYVIENAQTSIYSIKRFQVIQDNTNLCIKIVPGKNYSNSIELKIKEAIENKFGPYFVFKFEYCDESGIEKERSGKVRLVKRINP